MRAPFATRLAALFLLAAAFACASTSIHAGPSAGANAFALPGVPSRLVTSRHVTSKEGVKYTILISAPKQKPPPHGFPVMYVLDGNTWFGITAAIARVLAADAPFIVIGIGYPFNDIQAGRQRTFDMTMDSAIPPQMPMMSDYQTGGEDIFLRFINETLRPRIERQYKIDTTRQALFGHSLSALFVLHTLYSSPAAFSTYIAASPAIWWSDFAIAKQEQRFAGGTLPTHPPQVLITVGGNEGILSPTLETKMRQEYSAHPEALGGKTIDEIVAVYKAIAAQARMVDAAREAAARLTAFGIKTKFYAYEDEEHITEPPLAITQGIELFLNDGH